MNTTEKLGRYYELKLAINLVNAQEQAEIDTILAPEIIAQVEQIRQKWADTE